MKKSVALGVSTCLLGERVRYDGELKRDLFVRYTLGRWVEFVPICPEAECGFGVPREACYLAGDPSEPQMITCDTKRDLTDIIISWSLRKLRRLREKDLRGFIFKSRSPSCGLGDVLLLTREGDWRREGTGIFAALFRRNFPDLPVIDERALKDRRLRRRFIEEVFPPGGEWEAFKRRLL